MDELELLGTDQTNIYIFTTMEAGGDGWDPVKLAQVPSNSHHENTPI